MDPPRIWLGFEVGFRLDPQLDPGGILGLGSASGGVVGGRSGILGRPGALILGPSASRHGLGGGSGFLGRLGEGPGLLEHSGTGSGFQGLDSDSWGSRGWLPLSGPGAGLHGRSRGGIRTPGSSWGWLWVSWA